MAQRASWGRPAAASGTAWAGLRGVPAYALRHLAALLALLGAFSLWDAWGDGTMPGFGPLLNGNWNPHCVSAPHCILEQASDAERWLGLVPALAILDEVNPDVAAWVRDRHARGKLVFSNSTTRPWDNRGWLARYDHWRGRLMVQRGLFAEKDGQIAAILCHEYRHARQNAAKLLRCALSFVLRAEGDRSILENDAELYEREAELAIFGGGRLSAADALAAEFDRVRKPSARAVLAHAASRPGAGSSSNPPHHRWRSRPWSRTPPPRSTMR